MFRQTMLFEVLSDVCIQAPFAAKTCRRNVWLISNEQDYIQVSIGVVSGNHCESGSQEPIFGLKAQRANGIQPMESRVRLRGV